MSAPKLFSVKPNDTKPIPPNRSLLPVPKPAPPCPPQEQIRTKHKQMPKITESKSELRKSTRKPATAPTGTPSLSLPRAASASLVETRDRPQARHKPAVLSYNHLCQENQRLRGELLSLRSALEQTETEKREENSSMSSEIDRLTVRLTAANTAVSQLSEGVSSHQEQTSKLLSVLEGRGIDPLSADEVLTRQQRMAASQTAKERTRAIADYLNRQNARHTEIQASLSEKREEMLAILSQEQQEQLGDIIDTRFLATTPVTTGIEEAHSCN